MEFTKIKNSVFGGYNRADVVRYISELNEEHSAEMNAKKNEYTVLKESTERRIGELNSINKANAATIEELTVTVNKLKAELENSEKNLSELRIQFDTMEKETASLRSKSEIIASAIINAEKCAGELICDANKNAEEIISEAQLKVKGEAKKLDVAKDYIRELRQSIMSVFQKIDDSLQTTETEISVKRDRIENPVAESDADTAEKMGVIQKNPWLKRA